MDNAKDDKYYLNKLIEDTGFIIKHTKDISKKAFTEDEILQDSMMFRMIQISANVLKLSEDFRNNHNEIPWYAIRGLRNRIVHDYGNVDLTIIYDTISKDIPEVHNYLTGLAKLEHSD